jgi:hypothetical protein
MTPEKFSGALLALASYGNRRQSKTPQNIAALSEFS